MPSGILYPENGYSWRFPYILPVENRELSKLCWRKTANPKVTRVYGVSCVYSIKVNSMKHTILAVTILFSLAGTSSVLAEEQVMQVEPLQAITSDATETTATENPDTVVPADMEQPEQATGPDSASAPAISDPGKPCPMRDKAMKAKGKAGPCKGKCDKKKGSCRHDKHQQVVERLDLIDARLAKIEAMLESLLRR